MKKMVKRFVVAITLMLVCIGGYARSLQRFINHYSDVEGVVHKVFNRDSHFNDVPPGSFSPFSLKVRSGALGVMGIEEMVVLQLGECRESVQEHFVENVGDAIPDDYTLVAENSHYQVYMNNHDEEYAYVLIVNNTLPGLTLMYVTNGFVRAMLNDNGDGFDPDKLEGYIEQGAEKMGEALRGAGERLREGLNRLQQRAEEWDNENDDWEVYF